MPTKEEVAATLLEQIQESAKDETRAPALLQLAEALAWVLRPSQSHGGSSQ